MQTQLFEGGLIRLTNFDPEKDAEVESHWTHDPEFWHLTRLAPALPLSPSRVKKLMEAREKQAKEGGRRFDFAVRLKADNRLIGFAQIDTIEWNNQAAWMHLAIADPADRGQGCGSDAMRLVLRYAFHELGLFRLATDTYEYNPRGVRFLERYGFVREVIRRQAIRRAGRCWAEYRFGLLRPDWEKLP